MSSKVIFAANTNGTAANVSTLSLITNAPIASISTTQRLDLELEFDRHYSAGKSVGRFLVEHSLYDPKKDSAILQYISRKTAIKMSKIIGISIFAKTFGDWSEIESERIILVFEHIGYTEDLSGRVTQAGTFRNQNGKVDRFTLLQEVIPKVYTIFRDMNMPIEANAIKFAIENEINYRRNIIRQNILSEIKYDGRDREKEWEAFASYYFDLTNQSKEYVIGVMKKFIHQVKTKMNGMEVNNHLMPVIFGGQGVGKSYFTANILCQPLNQLVKKSDFANITDIRNGSLWQFPILFLDEMQNVTRSDVDAIKNRITSSTIDFRPMGTNAITSITNNATFIGTTNAANLSELVRDTTGNRRFAPLFFRSSRPEVEADLGFTPLDLWKSVDPAQDPFANLSSDLTDIQSEHRFFHNVKNWLEDLIETEGFDRLSFKEANLLYVQWCKTYGEVPVKVAFFNKDLTACVEALPGYKVTNPKNRLHITKVQSAKIVDFAE